MFTGLVEEIGIIIAIHQDAKTQQWILTIAANVVLEGVKLGDSIAVNGVCLTVTEFSHKKKTFVAGLSPETLRRTNLGDLKAAPRGTKDLKALDASCLVNLERSLAANGRVGGHFMQGHVDGVGTILQFRPDQDSVVITVRASPDLLKFIVPKGYVTVDGTSLTVVETGADWFSFMLVQYTQSKIVVARKKAGEKVNLEVDIIGKYVHSFLSRTTSVERCDVTIDKPLLSKVAQTSTGQQGTAVAGLQAGPNAGAAKPTVAPRSRL